MHLCSTICCWACEVFAAVLNFNYHSAPVRNDCCTTELTDQQGQNHLLQRRLQAFLETSPEQLQNVVQTNLVGSLLCARGAWRVMSRQPNGGHIFNIDGAGADGGPTPQYAAYGATKAGGKLSLRCDGHLCTFNSPQAQPGFKIQIQHVQIPNLLCRISFIIRRI